MNDERLQKLTAAFLPLVREIALNRGLGEVLSITLHPDYGNQLRGWARTAVTVRDSPLTLRGRPVVYTLRFRVRDLGDGRYQAFLRNRSRTVNLNKLLE